MLLKLEIPGQMFKKFSNKISRKSAQWKPSYSIRADERADTYDEADSRFWLRVASTFSKLNNTYLF